MRDICDILIIGAGPAGMMSAIYAKRENKSVVLVDKFTPGGRIKTTFQVDNYLGFGKVSAQELVQKMINHLHDLGIQEVYGLVQNITKKDHIFEVQTDEEIILAKSVIVATGTGPKPLNVPNEDKFIARGISYCAGCDAIFFENEDVVMIGGGDSALEESLYLSDKCRSVTIIHDLNELNGSKSFIDEIHRSDNITLLTNTKILSFEGIDELTGVKVQNIETQEETIVPCSGAFVYVGNQADTSFLSHFFGSTQYEYIEVNQEMKTKIEGLFACGDVTKKDYRFIVTAISDGAIAALSAVKYVEKLKK